MRVRLLLLAAGSTALLAAISSLASAENVYPGSPLPRGALFAAVTPKNIEVVGTRIDGSANERNQIPTGTVLVYKTSQGNLGKMKILRYGYDLYVRYVTYKPNGTILTQADNFRIEGTYTFDLDTGRPAAKTGADLWWERVNHVQRYLVFENGATFTIVG